MEESVKKLGVATVEAREQTDQELVASVLAGDGARFEEIFIRHRAAVARVGSRFFPAAPKIEEIVQETFAKAYFALNSYSHERGPSLAAWLAQIAINTCYDELRRTRRRPEGNLSPITESEAVFLSERVRDNRGGNAESDLISRDLAQKLLSRLNVDDRLVLTLLDGEQMPVADIAQTLGWGVSKVKVRAHRARASLRRVLKDFI
jgi:RNA polymerase sigma-70 factor (ECF subfamily)